ncbi:exported hypothetical protein [uncultured spirochete]|jgi:hypothetical protein|uniref:Uncharacterized protein n=1 Tax=uncultured spirochete TaxID=156406 RepID=A0A3P3XMG5_9SPIR|nr:hypothetical protein [Rectinema subterraneum]SLM15395.1 exported hypothetical protein [uncultured spirochete]
MKRHLALFILLLIIIFSVAADQVELYYNGNYIKNFYLKDATGYSVLNLSTKSANAALTITIDETYGKHNQYFLNRLYRITSISKMKDGTIFTYESLLSLSQESTSFVSYAWIMPSAQYDGYFSLRNSDGEILAVYFDFNLNITRIE